MSMSIAIRMAGIARTIITTTAIIIIVISMKIMIRENSGTANDDNGSIVKLL